MFSICNTPQKIYLSDALKAMRAEGSWFLANGRARWRMPSTFLPALPPRTLPPSDQTPRSCFLCVYKTPNTLCAKKRGVASTDEGKQPLFPNSLLQPCAPRASSPLKKSAQATWLLPPYFYFAKIGKAPRNSVFVSPRKNRGRQKLIKQSHAKWYKSRGGYRHVHVRKCRC